jgi:hypothetical protein
MASDDTTIAWLLRSDVSIQWQVLRDLLGVPEEEWLPIRRSIEKEGWGKELLSHQDEDGRWAAGCFVPPDTTREEWQSAQPWTATYPTLCQLRELGLHPDSARAKKTVELIGKSARWDEGNQPFWDGEVEECINGQTVANGAYFGIDVSGIVNRLLTERQEDGGWNCQRAEGSVRSSFATTINVLEGLLEYEKATGGSPEVKTARKSGEEYLLKRHLFKRLTTGEPADDEFLRLVYPTRWHYGILRALDYFRAVSQLTGDEPDRRLQEAVQVVRSKRRDDGTWAAEWEAKGRAWLRLDEGVGSPSPFITLRALRVLKWWDQSMKI